MDNIYEQTNKIIVIMKNLININLSQSAKVGAILFNKKYTINKLSTFTNKLQLSLDNNNETNKNNY